MRLALAAGVLCMLAATAHADRADQLFDKGKKLLAAKKYAEACTAFEDSDRIDPAIGTKLNVARCYEEWGKLATAWQWYSDAEQLAERAKDPRAPKIRDLLQALDPTVPRLTVIVPRDGNTEGLAVKLDGVDLPASALGRERRVDPGPHQVEYVVEGAKQSKLIPVERGGSSEITLELPAKRASTPGVVTPPSPPERPIDPGRNRRLIALGVGGAGVLAMGIAGIVVYSAHGDYDTALDDHCNGATDMCDDEGLSATRSARSRANVATVITLGGMAAVATGMYLYLTAPKAPRDEPALSIAPSFGPGGNGLVISGAF